jgi:hypothetical protein
LAYYKDSDNDWQTHRGVFMLNYEAPAGLIIGINEVYTDAEDPYGSATQHKKGVPRTKRSTNDVSARIGWDFGNRFKALFYCKYYRQNYDLEEDYAQDFDTREFGVGLQMRVLPKTWGFIRYHFGEQDYFSHKKNVTETTDADSDWRRVNLGLTWDAAAKLSGEVNFGYQWREYDNEFDSRGERYDDKDTWIAATSVNYAATATTSFTLNLAREVRSTGADKKEYFEDTGIGLQVQQRLVPKVLLTLGAMYSNNDFNTGREDDNYNADVDLKYQVQDWLSTGVGYKYMKKDSNYSENDYADNQFIFTLSMVY